MVNPVTRLDRHRIDKTILVAEDDVLTRMLVSDCLRDCGFRVFEAANGEEAVQILRFGGREINLVFSDLDMPGSINGFDLAQWAHDNKPGTKLILTSGNVDGQQEAVAMNDTRPLLEKPYSCSELLTCIHLVLGVENSH